MKSTIKADYNNLTFLKLNHYMILVFVILSSCTCIKKLDKMPSDFDFIAKYGIAEENTINTFDNTFTKKINWDKDTTISIVFPEKEKEKVYKKIKHYAIDELPVLYNPESSLIVSPAPTYYLKFIMNGSVHEITWETNTFSQAKMAKRLRDIYIQIDKYLKKQDAISNLPEDKRGAF